MENVAQHLDDNKPVLASMKKWLSKEDIYQLYGKVSDQHLRNIRNSGQVTYSRHPLARSKFIYLAEDLKKLVEKYTVLSNATKEHANH